MTEITEKTIALYKFLRKAVKSGTLLRRYYKPDSTGRILVYPIILKVKDRYRYGQMDTSRH